MQFAVARKQKNPIVFQEGIKQTVTTTANSSFFTKIYYGDRYLDPKTSRWISGDPAMGEYIPGAPVNDEARKRNKNLPDMGGIFNVVNMHVYHYAGNNPIKLMDAEGNEIVSFFAFYTMEDYGCYILGNNSPNDKIKYTIGSHGCYITTFANMGFTMCAKNYSGKRYGDSLKTTVVPVNNMKDIFGSDSGIITWYGMNKLFGTGRWQRCHAHAELALLNPSI